MGHRDDAINIPIADIISGQLGIVETLPKDTRIECYCASGMRSAVVKGILESKGYTDITNLGGI